MFAATTIVAVATGVYSFRHRLLCQQEDLWIGRWRLTSVNGDAIPVDIILEFEADGHLNYKGPRGAKNVDGYSVDALNRLTVHYADGSNATMRFTFNEAADKATYWAIQQRKSPRIVGRRQGDDDEYGLSRIELRESRPNGK